MTTTDATTLDARIQSRRAVDPADCSCAEGRRAAGISRRALLGAAGVLTGSAVLAGTTQLSFAAPGYTGDTVVVLSLRGGFDGLSAVVPVGDPGYAAARPTIGLPTSRVIPLDAMFGLHPALAPLKALWDAGSLAAVHAVGQLSATRSHFEAMQEMENAAPGSSLRTGWLDRMVGLNDTGTFSSAAVGSGTLPPSMIGPVQEIAIESVDKFTLSGAWDDAELARWTKALRAMHADARATIATPAATTLGALSTTTRLAAAGYTPANDASYPDSDAGNSLREVARLIKAGVGLRAATVDVGNWDMHVNLGKSDQGWMFNQLTDLGKALAAFATDLGPKLDDVTLVTLSEFGRRVAENGSGGVDHGHGNVSLVLGGGVKGGKVYGRWPGLGKDNLVAGDLAGTTDYRTVLAEILEKRGRLSSSTVFPDLDSSRLGLMRSRS